MELRTLRYFLAIAREENMTIAANSLHVSQSALSRQMSELEAELGKTLFVRTNRKTMLTEEGMHLRGRAEEIISLVDKTEMEFQSTEENIYGEIHIGAGETKAFTLIAKAIKTIQDNYPNIKFHIYSGNAVDVVERLEHGSLDFGLLFEPVSKENYNYIDIPMPDTMGVLMRKDDPFAHQTSLSTLDLCHMPLMVSARANPDTILSKLPEGSSETLDIKASYNLIYNASLMVEEGIGNALAIDYLINTSGDSPLVFVPIEPTMEMHTVFAWKKYKLLTKAQEVFLRELKKVCQ